MNNAITIYEIKQELSDNELEYLLTMEQDNICFFRFTGGNPSETESLIKKLYHLRERNVLLFIIFRFPFRFEGKSRMEAAIHQFFKLKDICDGILYFYSDGMMEVLDSNTSIKEAKIFFEQIEQRPIQAIREMLNQTGDINIDVQDIKAFVKNNKDCLFIRTFEGDTFDEPLKYVISAPYLPEDFAESNQLLINIGYSQDVDMNAFRQINLRLNDLFHKAEIFKLGSYLMNTSGSNLKITIMANGISDPFSRPRKLKSERLYRYWLLDQWEKVTKLGKPATWFDNISKKDIRTEINKDD
ncbi:cell division protein FtsZ [Evansella sp. AB-P1]|uniref:cell division protein FtsZ n=1 Tax=Evansella sp. AB-P1 TaxID=3037653 RepID=UPI00241F5AB7|nr:cell division protein FtsZ [Evansella sp. AB-P1]MDG5789696.1 cell division protein FtsZ [Evansella sp. AB-P1]